MTKRVYDDGTTELVSIDFDLLERIVDRFDNSDEFDDLEYCINDLAPATRGNPELTARIAKIVRQWRSADESNHAE